jgi:aerobic-type carbon monoxide dehydrogenase small subunit (CoxS/CutS family)
MESIAIVSLTINGRAMRRAVSPRLSAAEFIRQDLGLTGTHIGCEHGVCGACTIVVDGAVCRGCLLFAVQLEGRVVETIEGATQSGRVAALQAAFVARNALQCGFCTPGMILTAAEALVRNPEMSRADIREAISGNLCRCTGYEAIVDAIESCAGRAKI